MIFTKYIGAEVLRLLREERYMGDHTDVCPDSSRIITHGKREQLRGNQHPWLTSLVSKDNGVSVLKELKS